ncbi:MAG TPA: non-canonical purine NTP pyrophosphatase, partial [Bacteroidota bacterium]|nr:non-canonical purine NTP pyrophosphatase [Bacteroidota bacterium]
MKLLLATRNPGKEKEMAGILGASGFEILTLVQFPDAPEVEEDQPSFEGNAFKKARTI